jgi:hypothetical protein
MKAPGLQQDGATTGEGVEHTGRAATLLQDQLIITVIIEKCTTQVESDIPRVWPTYRVSVPEKGDAHCERERTDPPCLPYQRTV